MINLKKLLPSPSVREYLKKTEHSFSLAEEATLVFNSPLISQSERLDALHEIVSELNKTPEAEFSTYRNLDKNLESEKISATLLAEQIEVHIKNEMEIEADLFRNPFGGIYSVALTYKNEKLRGKNVDWGYAPFPFSCIENAIEEARKENVSEGGKLKFFTIKLHKIDETDKYLFGRFSADGTLLSVDSSFMYTDIFSDDDFVDFYAEIPYPVNDGDIVRELHTGRIGVVNHLGGEKDGKLKNITKRNRDISDIIVPVDMLDDDGNFVYEPFFTPCVEYAWCIDESKGDGEFLSEAALLVKGCGSLEYFCDLIKKRLGKD